MTLSVHKPMPGDNITDACASLLKLAITKRKPAAMLFNQVVVVAYGHETPDDLADQWQQECEAADERWRASPDGIAFAEKRERERQEAIERAGEHRGWPLHAVLTAITGRVWGDFGTFRELADWVDGSMSTVRTKVLANMPTIPEGIDTISEADWPTSESDLPAKMIKQVDRFGPTIIVGRAVPSWVNA